MKAAILVRLGLAALALSVALSAPRWRATPVASPTQTPAELGLILGTSNLVTSGTARLWGIETVDDRHWVITIGPQCQAVPEDWDRETLRPIRLTISCSDKARVP